MPLPSFAGGKADSHFSVALCLHQPFSWLRDSRSVVFNVVLYLIIRAQVRVAGFWVGPGELCVTIEVKRSLSQEKEAFLEGGFVMHPPFLEGGFVM